LAAAILAVGTSAQAPGGPPPHEHEEEPAPTNLKVLPKNFTGEQVHQIMHKWSADLGTHCDHCHAPAPGKVGPNGRPQLNFADDTKPEKATARLMYKMTEDININYVGKIDTSGAPVTCGTCHRGHLGPEPFVPPQQHHDHDGPPPAGQQPPQPH
jgi:hypothetical protein